MFNMVIVPLLEKISFLPSEHSTLPMIRQLNYVDQIASAVEAR